MRYGLVLQALEGHEGSSSEDEDAAGQHSQGPTYVQEQQQLRQAFCRCSCNLSRMLYLLA